MKITDSGGTEKLIYPPPPETSTASSSQSHPESSGRTEVSQSFGRIIRDESGTIIDVQLPESDESDENEDSHVEGLQASNGEVVEGFYFILIPVIKCNNIDV